MPGTQVSLSEVYIRFAERSASTDFIYVLQSCRLSSIWCHTSLPLYQWQHLFCIASLERWRWSSCGGGGGGGGGGGIACQQRVLGDLSLPAEALWLLTTPTLLLEQGQGFVCVCADFHGCSCPEHSIHMSEKAKNTFDIRLQITSMHTHAKTLRRASVPYVGERIRCETNYHRRLN